jgi:peptidoglycan/LPS O-acetylase OafA/YrhL
VSTDDRLPALDGLRGLAAVVVLLSHVVLASVVALGNPSYLGGAASGGWRWAMNSPLAIVWAGSELVVVFFVLSGFVLTRAACRDGGARWRAVPYLVARLVRLYVPVWGAVLLALALALLLARPAATGAGNLWLDQFREPVGFAMVCHSLSLAVGSPGVPLDGALWSLHWEVVFSVALPLVVLAAAPLRRHAPLLAAAAVAVVAVAPAPGAATYLAPFAVGVALALREDAVVASLRGRRVAALLAPAAALLLTADLWLPGATRGAGRGGALVVVGAGLAVVAPLVDPRTAAWLRRPAIQWLGRRSFSLYLVHEPIVISLAFALGGPPLWVLLPVAGGASLATAAAFHRVVERPAQRLARQAARRAAIRVTPAPEPAPA